MKKVLFILFLFFALFAIGGYVYGKTVPRIPPIGNTVEEIEEIISPLPEYEVAHPQTLSIPKIQITASVESVGLDNKRNMDVPKNAQNVAWYNLGPRPGEKGNAVLAGHLDTVTGAPAVFYELNKLEKGDELTVIDKDGNAFTYLVTGKETYKTEEFPLQEVFGDTDRYRLNLITCTGTFDSSENNYSHRTVVYSELIR